MLTVDEILTEAAVAPPRMRTLIDDDRCVLLAGDCADLGEVLGEGTVDAIVTDPPAGIDFMGKGWDSDKGGRDKWIAWLRVQLAASFRALKPGGYALVWALPRTSHWTATAVEDAGFEIRDVHHHLFATGFPKSLDVSKAVDDHLGAERVVVGTRPGTGSTTFAGEVDGKGLGPVVEVTKPATPEAEEADGIGTALKPAVEHWILAQKPREGTYAANWLRYRTGGINVDACRIGTEGETFRAPQSDPANRAHDQAVQPGATSDVEKMHAAQLASTARLAALGRWPAHLSLEHAETCGEQCVLACPVRLLDEQSRPKPNKPGASRFFFVAKGSRSEKDEGLDHLAPKTGGEATGRVDGTAGLGNPRAGAGRTGGARNSHPTVKSIALMQWLVRLITPPGGIVLDPFAGSGTTGVAALAEGCSFVGVEQGGPDGEYLPIVEGRLRHALKKYAGTEHAA